MKKIIHAFLASILAIAMAAFAQSEQGPSKTEGAADAPSAIKFKVEFSGQTTILDSNDRWSKFVEHREIPKNFVVPHLDFSLTSSSPWIFEGTAEDIGQLDARYRLKLEKFGRFRSEFRYISWPWFQSRLVTAPYNEASPNFFTVPTALRISLQTATSAQIPAIINDFLANTPSLTPDLQLRRQRFVFGTNYALTRHISLLANVTHDRRGGHTNRSLGVYERTGTPIGGLFAVLGDELPERIDNTTTEVSGGLEFHGSRGFMRAEYIGSFFQNDLSFLRWTNPFSAIDQVATQTVGGPPSPPNASGSFNRWRFATGQLQPPPDSRAHTFALTARVNLPMHSFAAAAFSYGKRLQDQQFLPITLNTAITAPVCGVIPTNGCLPAGVTPTSLQALPRQNLAGDVRVINGDVVVGTREWKPVLLTARYRNYRYDNNTEPLELPGYGGFGEALWRFTIGGFNPDGTAGNFTLASLNEPLSYTRQQASIEAVWKPNSVFQWKLEPTWEAWNRIHREVGRTNDFGVKTQFLYEPTKWLNARLNYRYSSRRPESFIPNELEFFGKRNYDLRRRVLNDAGIIVNLASKGPWLFTGRYNYTSNAYGKDFYGLNVYRQASAGAELNYAPADHYGLVVYYNHDQIRYDYRQIAKGGGTTISAAWNTLNEWDRNTRDKVDAFGIGFNANAMRQKLEFNANYDVSFGKQEFDTFNPSTPQSNMALDATAFPWPDIDATYHEARLETVYAIRRNAKLGARYIFQPFRLDDFTLDVMQPFMVGLAAPETDPTRFLFLNARPDSYDAHAVSIFLKITF